MSRRTTILSDAERAAIIKAYVDGVALAVIAARWGVSKSYPCKLARRRKLALRFPREEALA